MEELQTDILYSFEKSQTDIEENCDKEKLTENSHGCEEDDPLDLMDHCENASIGSNSDIWKGSDSEDERDISNENVLDGATTTKEIINVAEKSVEEIKENTDNAEVECSQIGDESPQLVKELIEAEPSIKSSEPPNSPKRESQVKENEIVQEQNEEKDENPPEESKDETETPNQDDTSVKDTNEDKSKDNELLASDKYPLAPSKDSTSEVQEVENDCHMDYDTEEDDDFDPSLLCPEVSMDVDENPVVTTNSTIPVDSSSGSPLPYEPLFSTFVDDVTGAEISFNLTSEEFELRKSIYGLSNSIQTSKIHCTACNVHLGSALEGQNNRFVHPLLKVLICKDCYHFYTSGEFEKDEDGSELYCRWCGQGGQVLCCSQCEFVFCKRCIRTNFGRKKMFEIRDSDSWDCFRCNPSQIMNQRVQCYEFFEYIRREMANTSTENNPEHWSKDYTLCCLPKKRPSENEEPKKIKKRKESRERDPDYTPTVESSSEPNPALNLVNAQLAKEGITLPKPIRILPEAITKDNDIEFVRQISPPRVTINNRPAFRAILPSIKQSLQSTVVRISAQPAPPPLVPTNQARILNNALQGKNNFNVKHDWFEKTVKAAARVNSHLSYTLNQLNKAQTQAGSVEELAVVHNKLQEILSSSINSLIQIRKNLRTEFISGIKTVKLPAKKVESFSNDDDVICVTPPTITVPTPARDPLAISRSDLIREKPKTYLKVKSVQDLQNVPAECITIPDDTPPPNVDSIPEDVDKSTRDKPTTSNGLVGTNRLESASEVPNEHKKVKDKITKVKSKELIFIVKNQPAHEIRKMMSVKVKLIREDLEELQKNLLKENN